MSAIGPFAHPAEGSKPAAPTSLTAEEQTKYDEVIAAVKSWETIPKTSAKTGAEEAPLADEEKQWITRECILRYLRATKWVVPQAIQRLKDTLIWRREYGTYGFTADYISEENATGKQVQLGFDKEGRPCLYLLPNKQNTKNSPKQVEHLVYMLERTLDLAPPGQENLALVIDFRNSSSGSQPSMATARQVLNILQNHYPERLGRAYIIHLPWYITAFLKLIGPFIDPVTKTKLRYNEPLVDHIPVSQLMKNAEGEVDFTYDHGVYWPALTELTAQRRKERKERWEAGGKIIGESEIYLWGGDDKSLNTQTPVSAEPAAPVTQPVEPAQESTQAGKPEENVAKPVEPEQSVQPAQAEQPVQSALPVQPAQNDNTGIADDLKKLDVKENEPGKKVEA